MSGTAPLNDEDYVAIEEAVMETARGRWFLNEHARRHRAADTSALFSAIHKIERSVAQRRASEGALPAADVALLLAAIEASEREMSAYHNDRLSEGGDLPADRDVLEAVCRSTQRAASELAALADELQGIARGMCDAVKDEKAGSPLDGLASRLFDHAWRQDLVAQRVGAALSLVRMIREKLSEARGASDAEAAAPKHSGQPALSADNLRYFSGDEDLFQDAALPKAEAASRPIETQLAPQAIPDLRIAPAELRSMSLASLAPPAAAKGRIIVIRRHSSGETAIPLADEVGLSAPSPAA